MSSIVRLPRLLNADLSEKVRLHPAKMPLTIQTYGVSTAQMTLGEDEPDVRLHDFLELYTIEGSVGLFRATNTAWTVRRSRVITLRHGRDTFADSVWKRPDGTNLDYSGTVPAFLAEIISRQNVAYWQLGTCEDTGAWKKSGIYYTRLSELLDDLEKKHKDYIFTYDFSTTPWTLNFVHMPTDITEFRLSRNVSGCKISYDDEAMCNKLYMTWSVNTEDGRTQTIRTYENATSQATYGIIEKTVDVKESDEPSADAWAAAFLAERADPTVQISIDGANYYALTGVALDRASRGKMARVALPEYGITVNERIIAVKYSDVINEPHTISAELSNNIDTVSSTLAQIQKTANEGSHTASDALESASAEGRRARVAEGGLSSEISQTASEIRSELYSADSDMRSIISQTASQIRSELWAADSKLFSSITQTATEIRSEVSNTESGLYSAITQTASTIRSEIWETDSKLYSTITQTASSIRSEVASTESGLYSTITQTASEIRSEVASTASGLRSTISQTASEIRSEVASSDSSIWSSVTANASSITSKVGKGEVISMINQTSETITISANKIDLSGYVTASQLGVTNATISNLTSGTTVATALKATLLQADNTFNFAGSNMHLVELSCGGTSLHVMSSANANVSFGHYHAFSVSESNGVISLTLGADQHNSPGTQTFNMADTAYFQQQMSAYKEDGWDLARSFVDAPSSSNTTSSFTIGVPSITYNNGSSFTYTVSCDNNYAYIKNASNVTVARVSNSAYDNGWAAAYGKVSAPAYGTGSTMSVGVPSSTVGGTSSMTFTLSCYTNYAYITYGGSNGTVVARVANPVTPASLTTGSASSNGTYYPSSGYNGFSSFTVSVPSSSYSSSDLHISKSSGKILLYLANHVVERLVSIEVTSLVKSSQSSMYTITLLIDGDTTFTFSKLPS